MNRIFYLLVQLLFFSALIGQTLRIGFGPRNSTAILLSDVIVMGLFGTWIAWRLLQRKGFSSYRFGFEIGLFLFVGLISWLQGILVFSDFGLVHYGRDLIIGFLYLGRLAAYFCLYFVFRDLLANELKFTRFFSSFVWICFFLALLGFAQLSIFPDFTLMAVKYGWDPHMDRLLSTWFDPNFLGSFFALAISIMMAVFFSVRERKVQAWLLVSSAVIALATFFTYSRSGYLALGVALLLFGVLYKRRILALMCVMLVLTLAVSPRAFDRVTGAASLDATAWKRIDSWSQAFSVWSIYPVFGVGYNLLPKAQDVLGTITEDDFNNRGGFENSFLTVLATMGVVGILTFLYLFLKILLYLWIVYRKRDLPLYLRGRALGLFIGIIALCASAMFIHSLFYAHILLFVLYFLAEVEADIALLKQNAPSSLVHPAWSSPSLLIAHQRLGKEDPESLGQALT